MSPAARAGREIWFQEAGNIQVYPTIYHVYTSNDIPWIYHGYTMNILCGYTMYILRYTWYIHYKTHVWYIMYIPYIYHTYG